MPCPALPCPALLVLVLVLMFNAGALCWCSMLVLYADAGAGAGSSAMYGVAWLGVAVLAWLLVPYRGDVVPCLVPWVVPVPTGADGDWCRFRLVLMATGTDGDWY